MKKLSLIAALVLGGLVTCSIMAQAQESKDGKEGKGKRGGRPTVEQRVEQMTTALSLTDEQKPKVKAVLEDAAKKMQEIFASGTPREQMREKMQPIREEETKKLKDILTSEQFEKWQKIQEERRSRFGGGKKKSE
jgi:Spy/CpxP family protein refolding chaperone